MKRVNSSLPSVSVVVPNFNHARFLRQRLDSIYEQTFRDYEVILLDDRSTDASVSILREYADRHGSRLVENDKNSGSTFAQWNKGVELASGGLIWIAESDDYSDPLFLERCVEKLDELPSVGLAYSDSWLVDESGNRLEMRSDFLAKTLREEPERSDFVRPGAQEVTTRMIRWNTIPNASAVVFRKSIYSQAGGADQTMKLAGDWLMWIKMLQWCDFAYIATPLNYNRMHRATMRTVVGGDLRGLEEKIKVLRYVLENFPLDNQTTSNVLGTLAGPAQIQGYRRATISKLGLWEYLQHVSDDEILKFRSLKSIVGSVSRRILNRIRSVSQ